MSDGHTQYSSLFIMEVEGAAVHVEDDSRQAHWGEVTEQGNDVVRQEVVEFNSPPDKPANSPPDKPAQARDALTKTGPKARIIPNKVIMNTAGAQ